MEGSEETIGRYRLISPLEQPHTYIAYDPIIQREVTLRRFSPPAGLNRETAMFARDFLALAKLDHPHLVPIYDTGEAAGDVFVVMKRLDPSPLKASQGKRVITFGEIYSELSGIGSGLDYLYLSGYNPTSISIDDLFTDGRARPALDYCSQAFFYYNFVERYLETEHEAENRSLRHLVEHPSRRPWESPEERELSSISQATYTYALSGLLYYLTSGNHPSMQLGEEGESIPSEIEFLTPLFKQGLHPDPASRFPSADVLLDELRTALSARFEGETWESILQKPVYQPQQEMIEEPPAVEAQSALAAETVETIGEPETAARSMETAAGNGGIFGRRGLIIGLLLVLAGGILYFSFAGQNDQETSPVAITSATETPTEPAEETATAGDSQSTAAQTDAPTETLTSIPTSTPEPRDTATAIVITATPSRTPSPTLSPTPTSSPTRTPTSTPSATPTPAPFFIVEPSSINLREGPSPEYESIGFAYGDEFLEILAKTPDESWLNVRTGDGTIGWVNTLLGQIVPDDELDNLPLAVTLPPLDDN